MTNETIRNFLINGYNAKAYTDKYIIGFAYKKVVYFGFFDSHEIDRVITLSKTSKKNGDSFCIRFQPRNDQKLSLLTKCEVLCSEEFLNNETANSKYNKGEIFEKLITEKFNQVWKKDNVPFTKAGDITINGVDYQIKYQKATFCSEKQLIRLGV